MRTRTKALRIPDERFRELRRTMSTPTLPGLARALGNRDPDAPGRCFVYWQKWTWETEDMRIRRFSV